VGPTTLIKRFRAVPEHVGEARQTVVAYARRHGAADPDAVALAVSEALTNVVLHAYVDRLEPGDVVLVAERHPDDGLEVQVSDQGRGMKLRDDSPGIGVGLPLVATLAERVEIDARPGGGTRVRMVFGAR
jgi:anti-sigma regulatory factor (Ser/Thr protein kinase)